MIKGPTFSKIYPDFNRIPKVHARAANYLEYLRDYLRISRSIVLLLFIDALPKPSKIVYASPEKGDGLLYLSPFLEGHQTILIENYCMRKGLSADFIQKTLHERVDILKGRLDIDLIEADFYEFWGNFNDVDLLLLDGPCLLANYEPFADTFIVLMHDIWQRLRFNQVHPKEHLVTLYDEEFYEKLDFYNLSPELQYYFFHPERDLPRERQQFFGEYGWLGAKK